MFSRKFITVLFCFYMLLAATPLLAGELTHYQLDNGLDVLIRDSHGGPMVASIVTVGAGSRHEDEASYGASHFLEHMLFNGTSTRSREDINEGIKAWGGYINAFTRRDYTCFMLLIPSEYMEEGLAVQADMLFNSIMTPVEFEKEKLVVLEEMNKDYDSGSYRDQLYRQGLLFDGTPYTSPVLGTVATIDNLSREDVMAYYKERYRAANMRLYLMGDFEPRQARKLLQKLYGAQDAELAPVHERALPAWAGDCHFHQAEEGEESLDLYWLAPGIESGAHPALRVLASILSDAHLSPLRDGEGGTLDMSAGFELYDGFSVFSLAVDPDDRGAVETLRLLDRRLKNFHVTDIAPETVSRVARGLRFDDLNLADTYHFFAMHDSPVLHFGGFDYLSGCDAALRDLTRDDLRLALEASLWAAHPLVFWSSTEEAPTLIPADLSSLGRIQSTGEFAASVAAKPDEPVRRNRAGTAKLGRKQQSRASIGAGSKVKTMRAVLDNGLTVLIKSDPSGDVCAAHMLVSARSVLEPEGKAGIATLAHRLLNAGTEEMSEAELAAEITRLGLRFKLADNPWIPFDNYYTREDYSWMRLECLDEVSGEALGLMGAMLAGASYPEEAVASEKESMLTSLRMASPRPSSVARRALDTHIFAGSRRALPLDGTQESIAGISGDDLRAFHRSYFDPRRMTLSVVSGRSCRDILADVKRGFSAMESMGLMPEPASLRGGPADLRFPLEKTQVAIRGARILPALEDCPAELSLLTDVLSTRLGLELREKQGLAYSLGAGLRFVPGLAEGEKGFGVISVQIATGAQNRERAVEGMLAEIRGMVENPPSEEEIFLSVNGRWGRQLMRDLSRIHQAYQMGLAEHLGRDPFTSSTGKMKNLRNSDPVYLGKLAAQYLYLPDWIWVYAGGSLN